MITRSAKSNTDASINMQLVESNVSHSRIPVILRVFVALAVPTIIAVKLNGKMPNTKAF
jgi:hypothetical protein